MQSPAEERTINNGLAIRSVQMPQDCNICMGVEAIVQECRQLPITVMSGANRSHQLQDRTISPGSQHSASVHTAFSQTVQVGRGLVAQRVE